MGGQAGSAAHAHAAFQDCATQPSTPALPCSVAVLDGGLPAWKAAGGALDTSPVSQQQLERPAAAARAPQQGAGGARYPARLQTGEVWDWRAVLENVKTQAEQLVDARPAARCVRVWVGGCCVGGGAVWAKAGGVE